MREGGREGGMEGWRESASSMVGCTVGRLKDWSDPV